MKILITGANSFVGNAIARQLKKNNSVVAIARHFGDSNASGVKRIIVKDYKDYLNKLVKTDILIHCAWMGTSQDQRVNEKIQKSNYEISLAIINKAIKLGVSRIILAGSQAEYGPHNSVINENTELSPNTAYGKYKYKLFVTLKKKYPAVTIINARIFSSYGPGQDDKNMIPSISKKMINNEICEFTPATQIWNYIYIDDLAKLFEKLCKAKIQSSCINLASDDSRPLKHFIYEMKKVSKSKSKLVFGAKEYNSSGFVSLQPDISYLKSVVGKIKFTPFKIGIKNTIEYFRKNK